MAKKRTAKKARPAARRAATRTKAARKRTATVKPKARQRSARKAPAGRSIPTAPNPREHLARRIVDLTIGNDDEAALALYADTIESTEPGGPPAVGLDAIRQKFAMWRGMVGSATWRARNTWVVGNTIIIEWAGRVTFAASGKEVDFNEIAIHEVENGKIARERFYYDRSIVQP